jgi:hypothetical protein
MMRQEIIMTTTNRIPNIKILASPDLFLDNESLLMDRQHALQYSVSVPPLGAVTFVAARSSKLQELGELAAACAEKARNLVIDSVGKEFCVWLFIADGPWKPATRIARYNRLWRRHPEIVNSSGVGKVGQEVEFESGGQIRFAGSLEISGNSFSKAVELVRTNPSCAMIMSKRPDMGSSSSTRSIFLAAFPEKGELAQVRVDWMRLAINLCPQGDMLFRVSGSFDDHEAAVDVIAVEDGIRRLSERIGKEKGMA